MSKTRKQRATLRPTGYLTPREAARYLGCTDMGVKLWLKRGKLKGFKAPNGYWWVEETDLLRELKAQGISTPRHLMEERRSKFSVQPVEINVQAAKEVGFRAQASGKPRTRSKVSADTPKAKTSRFKGKVSSPDTLSPDEAAVILGVSAGLVRQWVQWGRLNATKTPLGHLQFSIRDINAILEARRSPQPMVGFVGNSDGLSTLLTGIITQLGSRFRTASTFAEALRDLALYPASLLFLDMDAFPDPWSMIRKVRSSTVYGTPRILLLTKDPLPEKAERMAIKFGVNGCLSHPISEEVLCSEIKAQLWKQAS